MKLWSRGTLVLAGIACAWVSGSVVAERLAAQASAQAPAGATPRKPAGEFFKNVTTSSLKGLPVDDFVETMGVISSALGLDCADCHPGAGTDKADFVTDTAIKRNARRMIEMVARINVTNFGGAQRVTCWTCHHGRMIPATSIALEKWYEAPNSEVDDVVVEEPQPRFTATQILDRYIAALGGAQQLARLTSFIATGDSIGYGGSGGTGQFTIYAKAPNQRSTIIGFKDFPERGESVWSFDGVTGWMKEPRALLREWEQIGGDLDGARLEAQMSFPGQIKQVLTNWRAGGRRNIDDRDYFVVQGSGPRGLLGTFYFDQDTGLLARMIRLTPSPVGRIQIQTDYGDYRDVGGIKFPFEYKFVWLDGRYTAKIKDVRTNVPIDVTKFGEPAPNNK
jgi:hypothetical protein